MRKLATLCLTLAVLLGSVGCQNPYGHPYLTRDRIRASFGLPPFDQAEFDRQKEISKEQRQDRLREMELRAEQLEPLAEQGDADAQFSLGKTYDYGQGVPQNDKTAVKWYRLAAEQGHAEAQYSLGVMYDVGEGVERDKVYAFVWYSIAATNGHGAIHRDTLAKNMVPAQIAKAKKLAAECVRKKYKECQSPDFQKGIALPECEGSPSFVEGLLDAYGHRQLRGSIADVSSWNNCEGTITLANLDKFVGEWKDGKRNGQGTYTFFNGDRHVGEFRDGKPNGQGTLTLSNGKKYVGEFRNGKGHGHGTYTYPSGSKYVGEIRNGRYHGQGAYTFADGSKYVGEHRNDKYHGQGTFTFASGEKHDGEWKNGLPNGPGIHTYADGRVKEGMYKNGKFKYAQKASPTHKEPTQNPSNSPVDKAKEQCAEIGFTKGTEKFSDCVMKFLN